MLTCGPGVPGCETLCTEDCNYASDSWCDDHGGSGAQYSACGFGTDCTDCGERYAYNPPPAPPPSPPSPTSPPAIPAPLSPPPCYDSDDGASDEYGYSCSLYYPSYCGGYDDPDFTSMTMCCACGGGITEAGSGEPSPPPTLPGGGM